MFGAAWLLAAAAGTFGVGWARDDRTVVMDIRAEPGERSTAARRMLGLPEADAMIAVLSILEPGAGPEQRKSSPQGQEGDPGVLVMLREIAGMCTAPAWMAEPLTRLAETGPEAQRLLAVRALGSVRTRDAAKALVRLAYPANGPVASDGNAMAGADMGRDWGGAGGVGGRGSGGGDGGGVQEAALGALARLTGRSDLGYDARKWEQWWRDVEFLPDAEWERRLGAGLAARADELARERDAAVDRVLATARKRFQTSTTIEDRSALLEGFILDDLRPVRRLGLELALQELANARTPGPGVANAAVTVLGDPSPEFRRLAADALGVLASPDTAGRINQALVFETDPSVAASLLRCAARWPEAGSVATVLRWLEAGEPALGSALDAASAMLDAGMLNDPADRSRVLAAAHALDPGQAPASGLRLLSALGDDADRARVVALLSHGDPGARQRAAEALAREGGSGLDALLSAAMNDSGLFQAAARAVVKHRATPEGFAAVAALPAPSPDERRQQLMLIARLLSPGELLAVARVIVDPEVRERLLARLTSEPLRDWAGSGPQPESGKQPFGMNAAEESPNPEVIAGLLLLAQTRLDLGQPGLALKALDALDPVRRYVDPTLLDSMRTLALLLLGQVSEAAKLNGSPESWVLGLEESLDEGHAMAIVREIDRRWGGGRMSPELEVRMNAARAGAGAFVGPTADVPR